MYVCVCASYVLVNSSRTNFVNIFVFVLMENSCNAACLSRHLRRAYQLERLRGTNKRGLHGKGKKALTLCDVRVFVVSCTYIYFFLFFFFLNRLWYETLEHSTADRDWKFEALVSIIFDNYSIICTRWRFMLYGPRTGVYNIIRARYYITCECVNE